MPAPRRRSSSSSMPRRTSTPAKKVKERTKRGAAVLKALRTPRTHPSGPPKPPSPRPRASKATTYWLTNVLVVEGDAKTLDKVAKQLAKVSGVTSIRAPKIYPLVKPVETSVAILAAAGDRSGASRRSGADEAWADGVLGQGIVVANIDTGVDFTHPPWSSSYRGNNGDGTFTHDYNWWDPSGICGGEPCDNVGHGTHTMGTMVGGDGPGPFTPDTGVAPGAQWIAAKGCEDFGCSESRSCRPASSSSRRPTSTATNPDPSQAPRHRQQLVGRRTRRHVLPRDRPGLARRRDHPGVLLRQPRPVLRRRRLARRLPRVVQRRRDRQRRHDRRLLGPRPVRDRQGQSRRRRARRRRHLDACPAAATRPSPARRWRRPHVAGTIALMLSAEPALRRRLRRGHDAVRATAVDRIDDTLRRRRGRRPEQRLRRRPDRRQGRRRPRGHRRHALRHRHRRRHRRRRSPAPRSPPTTATRDVHAPSPTTTATTTCSSPPAPTS